MDRKLGNFLPEQAKREIEDLVLQAIENNIDHTCAELNLAMEQVCEMWDETTSEELEGEKPQKEESDHTYKCPKCNCTIHNLNRYCHYCGAKINWSGVV